MSDSPFMKGKRILLRKPMDSDDHDYQRYAEGKEFKKLYGMNTRDLKPLTIWEVQKYIKRISSDKYHWNIEYNGHCVGEAKLTVNTLDNRGRYAVGLFDTSIWNNGLGTEVTRLVLTFAFTELLLHRMEVKVLEYNTRAISCFEKCGFQKEGIEREGVLIDNKYETHIIMSILKHEYDELQKKQNTTSENNQEDVEN